MNKEEYNKKMNETDLKRTFKKVDEADAETTNTTKPIKNEIEDLPDLTDFVKSDTYVRNGKNGHIPLKVEVRGQATKIFIRPLTTQEYYLIQLESMNKKESLDLLACHKVCMDSQGRQVSPQILDNLDVGVIETISTAIRVASGLKTEEIDMKEVMKDFLKD